MVEEVHGPLAQTPTPSAGMQKIVTKHSFFCLKGTWKRGRHVVVVRIRSDRVCSQNFVFTVGVVAFTIAITLGGQVLADRFARQSPAMGAVGETAGVEKSSVR